MAVKKPYNQVEELIYIKKAQEDPMYFGILYNGYFKTILLFVHSKIRDKDTAADITQQVFLKAMVNIGKYKDMGHPFSSWLYRIAFNEINMFFRKNKNVEVEVNERDAFELMAEIGDENGEEKNKFMSSINQELPDDQNQLIEMRFFNKLSFFGNCFNSSNNRGKRKNAVI